MSATGPPRPCIRCYVHKSPSAFPLGRGKRDRPPRKYRRTSNVCMTCIEIEGYERDVAFEKRKVTRRDPRTGRLRRRCSSCRVVKDLARGFHRSKSEVGGRYYICKKCATEKSVEYQRQRLKRSPASREQRREYRRRYLAKPEKRELERAYRKRKWRELTKDPVAYAAELENRRIYYRLRREREGATVRSAPHAKMAPTRNQRLAAAPLAALVERVIANRKAVLGLIAETGGATTEAVCADLGIDSRTFRRWRMACSEVQVGMAERVLLNAGVEWHEVYSYDDHAQAFLAHEVEV